jgi:hypothetical protein
VSAVVEAPKVFSCRFCRQPIPASDAKRCNACTAYQRGWRRCLPLPTTFAMLSPAMAVVTALVVAIPFTITQWTNYANRNSQTFIGFTGAYADSDPVVIRAHLWNTGRKPSTVTDYNLKLQNIHVGDISLLPTADSAHEVSSLVPENGGMTTVLLVRGMQARDGYSRQQVLDGLAGAKVTLCARIEETTEKTLRCADFDAELLHDVVKRRLTGGVK